MTDFEARHAHISREDRHLMESVKYRGRSEAVCWECDVRTSHPVETALGTLTALSARVILCPDCYRSCYVPLVAHTAMSEPVAQSG